MKLVVAGLSPREEAAFGMFMSRAVKGWAWESAPAGRAMDLPAADLLLVDLVAMGMAHWSEEAETDLLRKLRGTPAVLLVPTYDHTWATMEALAAKNALVWLSRPYGTEDMRLALEKGAAAVKLSAKRAPAAPAPTPAVKAVAPVRSPPVAPPAPPAVVLPTARVAQPVVKVSLPVVADVAEEAPGLTTAELQDRLAALPDASSHVFLRKLAELLAQEQPFEARFTVQNSVIFHPLDGWVASNTPMMVIQRVCSSDALASAVSVREIDAAQAEERTQRLGMPLRELDAFLWELASATLDKAPSRTGR